MPASGAGSATLQTVLLAPPRVGGLCASSPFPIPLHPILLGGKGKVHSFQGSTPTGHVPIQKPQAPFCSLTLTGEGWAFPPPCHLALLGRAHSAGTQGGSSLAAWPVSCSFPQETDPQSHAEGWALLVPSPPSIKNSVAFLGRHKYLMTL